MIAKTDALVLRVSPFSNTSHVVTWLTAHHGKLATVIKGARRPKSRFLGQYDLFYTCELLYYERARNGLHVVRECAPLDTRAALRSDWRAAFSASYFCGVVARTTPRGARHPELYALLTQTLDMLTSEGASLPLLLWFELRVLTLLGVGPGLTRCVACHGPRVARGRLSFSCGQGGLVCADCRPAAAQTWADGNHAAARTLPLSGGAAAIMSRWQADTTGRAVRVTRCSAGQRNEIRHILGMFLPYHLDLAPSNRGVALEMLSFEQTPPPHTPLTARARPE